MAISSSDGSPPAVTSDASVKVQYDSLLLAGAMVKVVLCCSATAALDAHKDGRICGYSRLTGRDVAGSTKENGSELFENRK